MPSEVSENDLRRVDCPMEIIDAFKALSKDNTNCLIETCGILAGYEADGILTISTLIIPSQEADTHTCCMVDEEELFNVQLKEGVNTLGWIHTHPQFDLFLSAVDLHNQHAYQSQLKEAVAIVTSPIVEEPGF